MADAIETIAVPVVSPDAPQTVKVEEVNAPKAPANDNEPAPKADPKNDNEKAANDTEPEKPPPPEDPKVAARLAAIAKAERRFRQQSEQTKQAIAAEKAELEAARRETAAFKALVADGKQNPLKLLEAAGVSYETLTNYILHDGKPPPELVAQQQTEAQKQEFARLNEQIEALKQQNFDREVDTIKRTIGHVVESSGDKYELIRATGQQEQVWNVIKHTWETTGRNLTIDQAADMVEDYLFKDVTTHAERLRSVGKLKSIFGDAAPAANDNGASSNQSDVTAKASPQVTLTNRRATPVAALDDRRHLTLDERTKLAAKELKWK